MHTIIRELNDKIEELKQIMVLRQRQAFTDGAIACILNSIDKTNPAYKPLPTTEAGLHAFLKEKYPDVKL